MIYSQKRPNSYKFLALEDAILFHDIPILIYNNKIQKKGYYIRRLTLKGLDRKEVVSLNIPKPGSDWNTRIYENKKAEIIMNGYAEKWPLNYPFYYDYNPYYERADLVVPKEIGNIVPYWPGIAEAARVAILKSSNDNTNIDNLFISLYNEIIDRDITYAISDFRSKYKRHDKTSTEKILEISDIPEDVKRFILRIPPVKIEREVGNKNRNSFDFVRARISIPTKERFPNRKEFIKSNMKYIVVATLNKLENMRNFTRYGIPVTCLSLKNATITCTSELELVFELKDELQNMSFVQEDN